MYGIIRLIIGFAFLVSSIIIIKKSKGTRKRLLYVVCSSVVVVFITILSLFPFENYFITFNSPKAAYEYYSFKKSNIELVIEGYECDFIVDCKNSSNTYLIIPKTAEGWKIGIGTHTKRIVEKFTDGITVSVYQYKNTSDYFIVVLDTNGGEARVQDDYGTKFYSLKNKNDYLGKTFYSYYAHIPDYNSQYDVTVNDNRIILEN